MIVTGSGGLDRLGVRAHFVEAGYDVVGIENDMRARVLRARRVDRTPDTDAARQYDAFRAIELDIRDADGVDGCSRDARGRARARDPHRRPALPRLGGDGPADGLRRQRGRHAQPARGDAAAQPDATFVFTSTNKVYGDRRTSCRSSSSSTRLELPLTTRTSTASRRPMSIDGCLHSLFGVVQGRRRSARPGIRALLRACRPSASGAAA